MKNTLDFPFFQREKKTIKIKVIVDYKTKHKSKKLKPLEKFNKDQTKKQRFFLQIRALSFFVYQFAH